MNTIMLVRANNGLFGGIETQIVNLATYLHEHTNINPVIATSPGPNPLAEQLSSLGISVEFVRFPPHGSFAASVKDLRRLIAKWNPRIVQAHMLRESLVGRVACAGTSSKHVYRVHTYIDCSRIPTGKSDYIT
ncbi:MAG: glycosyltransferase [bacterium]|nr:glycosyltransferase [bacterium]